MKKFPSRNKLLAYRDKRQREWEAFVYAKPTPTDGPYDNWCRISMHGSIMQPKYLNPDYLWWRDQLLAKYLKKGAQQLV